MSEFAFHFISIVFDATVPSLILDDPPFAKVEKWGRFINWFYLTGRWLFATYFFTTGSTAFS